MSLEIDAQESIIDTEQLNQELQQNDNTYEKPDTTEKEANITVHSDSPTDDSQAIIESKHNDNTIQYKNNTNNEDTEIKQNNTDQKDKNDKPVEKSETKNNNKIEFEQKQKKPQNKSKQNKSTNTKKKKKKCKKKSKKKQKKKSKKISIKKEIIPPISFARSTPIKEDNYNINFDDIEANVQQKKQSLLTDIEKKLFQDDNYSHTYKSRSQFQGFVEFPKKPQKSTQMQRLAYLLRQYQTFNNNMYPDNDILVYRFLGDGVIEDGMCFYDVKTLLNDYYYGLVHYCKDDIIFGRLYQYITSEIGKICQLKECQFVRRNHLSNMLSSEGINKKNESYYEFTEHSQHARLRLMDKIHCHICHSYDFGFTLTTNEKDLIIQEKKENEYNETGEEKKDNESNVMDYKIVHMRRIIRQKRKNLISIVGKENYERNKFVTTIGAKKRQESMFGLGDILKRNSTNITVSKLIDNDHTYKLGQKLYYWDYYKKAGWKWYIQAKFENLKQEMIGNNLVNISEWDAIYNKASNMSYTFLSKSYTAYVEKHFGNYFYGIKESEKLSINNIISVLLFCNCSLQRKLNASHIKLSEESDDELKKRHSFYANWARILCETVEIFRNITFYKTINDFYHGTNCCMYFNEIYASLYAPTSMTKSLEVLMCYGNEDGLLLDLMYINNNNRYFECNWVSNFVGENEILFVGSSKLHFKSIIHYSLCHNYNDYISAMTKIEDMLHGNPADEIITKPITKAVDELINYELKKDRETSIAIQNKFINSIFEEQKVVDYMFEFFHHFVNNINYHITMDMYIMVNDYKSINKYFLNHKKTFVAFDILCFIFRNVKYISLSPGWQLQQNCAVQLTRDNMIYLHHVLKSFVNDNNYINNIDENKQNDSKYPYIVCLLERISIENPRCDNNLSITDAVDDFKDMYKEIGWELKHNGWKEGDIGTPVLTVVKNK